MLKISGLVVAHNEEKNLAQCLDGLSFVDELVVVLDKTTDNSKQIAQQYTKNIYEGSWELEGARRNLGLSKCHCDWILELDADERIPLNLQKEILNIMSSNINCNAFVIPFDNYIGNRLVKYGWGAHFGVSGRISLFKRGLKVWGAQKVHPSLSWNTKVKKKFLKNSIKHYVDKDISSMIVRFQKYTDLRAQDIISRKEFLGKKTLYKKFFSRFFRCFVRRKGYKEGLIGFMIASLGALYPLISQVKAEFILQNKKKI